MAKIMLIGSVASIELTIEPTEGVVVATCAATHRPVTAASKPGVCGWTATYDDLRDATEYAGSHADGGDR